MKKLGSKDKVVAYWNASAPHLQARYCHTSLGTKIKVERIGEFGYASGKTLSASSSSLEIMRPLTKENLGEADLMVYMCHDTNSLYGGVIGIAYSGVTCTPPFYDITKQSINEWRPTPVAFGGVNNKYHITDLWSNEPDLLVSDSAQKSI